MQRGVTGSESARGVANRGGGRVNWISPRRMLGVGVRCGVARDEQTARRRIWRRRQLPAPGNAGGA